MVFSLKRAQAPSSQMKSLLSSVREVVAVDPLTVHIRTQGPDLVLPDNLTNLFIMSEAWTRAHQAEAPQDTASRTENYATRHVNGTGLYTLASREVDSRTVMKLNPAYWGKGQFPLQVTELTYVSIKSPATRVAALLSGKIDFYLPVWLGGSHPRLGLCLRLPGPHPGQESPGHLEHHGLQQPAARCPDRVAVL